MAKSDIKIAIEKALDTVTPTLATVRENVSYQPIVGTPYQRIWFMDLIPTSPEITKSHQLESYFQIDLLYKLENGTKDISTRAALIEAVFKKGLSFSHNGQIVNITKPAIIERGRVEGDRWKVCIKIYYSSWIIVN
jgi:hypothetical protein